MNEETKKATDTFDADALAINALVGGLRKMDDVTDDVAETVKDTTAEIIENTVAVQQHEAAVRKDTAATKELVTALHSASNAYREQEKTVSRIGTPLFPGLSGVSGGAAGSAVGGIFVQAGGRRATLAADGRIIFV
jgi:hypothetical protein